MRKKPRPIFFACKFAQRNRSFLHLIDPLIRHGYQVLVQQYGSSRFDYRDWQHNITGVKGANKKMYEYFAKTFGIRIKYLSRVKWVGHCPNKERAIRMSVDRQRPDKHKADIGIPYQGQHMYLGSRKLLCGNFMSEAITNEQKKIKESPNTILIIHPGGSRGIVSPMFPKTLESSEIASNNASLLRSILEEIPEIYNNIILKTHPMPAVACDDHALGKVLPLVDDNRLSVTSVDLIQNICKAKFVINIGSSTIWWLMGGKKRWINLLECSKFENTKTRRDNVSRADSWGKVPNNVSVQNLGSTIDNYDEVCLNFQITRNKISSSNMYGTPAVSRVLKVLKGFS